LPTLKRVNSVPESGQQLWLCLRFDQLPLQALQRRHADMPSTDTDDSGIAVVEKQRVLLCNEDASACGIRPGLKQSTIHALATSCLVLERDPEQEKIALDRLCCWAYGISPRLSCYRKDCLLLEIGGCLKLFHGVDALLKRIHVDLSSRAWYYRVGLAITPKAAWLLSHKADIGIPRVEISLQQQLTTLPLGLMINFPKQVESLGKAGLHSFGDILSLPTVTLGRRCGKNFVKFLRQVTGEYPDDVANFLPPPKFEDDYLFGFEVIDKQELLPAMRILLQSLCLFLLARQLTSASLEWTFYGINKHRQKLTVTCSQAHANWESWYRLLLIKMEPYALEQGIEGLALRCTELFACTARSGELFTLSGSREPMHGITDRLQNRLGNQAVQKLVCYDEHVPEFAGKATTITNLNTRETTPPNAATASNNRPFWLMSQPEPLRQWRDRLYWHGQLDLLQGPERIEDNWWRQPVSRDYYIARNSDGHRYWVFLDRMQSKWFVHGIFI
jgi:protein ImuB